MEVCYHDGHDGHDGHDADDRCHDYHKAEDRFHDGHEAEVRCLEGTKPKSAATLKRKYDDSDVSEYDDSEGDSEDDFDDDDDPPPPPPKKRKRGCRSSEDSTFRIKKRIKKYLLQLEIILPFKEVLLPKGAFSEIHWRKLYEQLGDKDECVHQLFFSNIIRIGESTSSALLEMSWHPTASVTFHT